MKTIDIKKSNSTNIGSKDYSILVIAIVAFLASCSKSDDPSPQTPAPAAPTACKIQTYTISSINADNTVEVNYTYVYDDKGNESSRSTTYKFKYIDGKTSTSTDVTNNQYDAEGFLTRAVTQSNGTDKDGKVYNSSSNVEYEYTNKLLSKQKRTDVSSGKTENNTYAYEYDSNGNLTKLASLTSNTSTKFGYSNGIIKSITQVDQYGNSTSPFLEYNKDGQLTKSIELDGGIADENRYVYDTEGQLTRYERYINTKPYQAQSIEYDTKENPNKDFNTRFKGHPTIPRLHPFYTTKHNVISENSFKANPTGQWEITSSSTKTYDYNSRNLPVEIIIKNFDKDGKQTGSGKTNYQYQDCL
jgi:YD repeat-containing protein